MWLNDTEGYCSSNKKESDVYQKNPAAQQPIILHIDIPSIFGKTLYATVYIAVTS